MKKRKKIKESGAKQIKNPVAKFAFQFNKAQVFKDKTKYQRNAKHKGQKSFPIMLAALLEKTSAFVGRASKDCFTRFSCEQHNYRIITY